MRSDVFFISNFNSRIVQLNLKKKLRYFRSLLWKLFDPKAETFCGNVYNFLHSLLFFILFCSLISCCCIIGSFGFYGLLDFLGLFLFCEEFNDHDWVVVVSRLGWQFLDWILPLGLSVIEQVFLEPFFWVFWIFFGYFGRGRICS